MRKNKAIEAIEQMPEDFQVDELIEKLIFIEQVESGLEDIKKSNLVSHEEVIRQSLYGRRNNLDPKSLI